MKRVRDSELGIRGSGEQLSNSESRTPNSRQWRRIALGDQTIAIPDDPLCAADVTDPANQLLADYAALRAGDVALVLGVGCGLLAAWVAMRIAPGRLVLCDTDSAALDRAAAT